MIFQYTWPQVVECRKTATRRVIDPSETILRTRYNKILEVQHNGRTKWRVGTTYAVQPGRGQKQIARIRLTRITRQKLSRITTAEAKAEGFDSRQEFMRTWEMIHGGEAGDLVVWVLEFELVETSSGLQDLAWPTQRRPVSVGVVPC